MKSVRIAVLAHNIRSAHNIGSLFRTCDGFGVEHLYLSGYSPYPQVPNDTRLPHVAERINKEISKTALGAEAEVPFSHVPHPLQLIDSFKSHGYNIIGLEQHPSATLLPSLQPIRKSLLILGEEIGGIPSDLLQTCTDIAEIPMEGKKESFNVSVAAGIALYALKTGVRLQEQPVTSQQQTLSQK